MTNQNARQKQKAAAFAATYGASPATIQRLARGESLVSAVEPEMRAIFVMFEMNNSNQPRPARWSSTRWPAGDSIIHLPPNATGKARLGLGVCACCRKNVRIADRKRTLKHQRTCNAIQKLLALTIKDMIDRCDRRIPQLMIDYPAEFHQATTQILKDF